MIIDIRGILNRIEKDKETNNQYSLDMVYQDGAFVPKLSKGEPKITISPVNMVNGVTEEFAGLSIVRTGPGRGKLSDPCVLCNNGLFIHSNYVKAKDILILPSFSDSLKAVSLLYNDEYVRRVSPEPNSDLYAVFAVYQLTGSDSLSFKFVYKP